MRATAGLQLDDVGQLVPAVEATLRALVASPEDSALHALVRQYAAAVDDAVGIAEAAALIEPDDEDQAKRLAALLRRVERQAVLAELGPKLQAALDALGASPKARAGMAKGGPAGARDGTGPDSKRSKLDALRVEFDGPR